MSLGTTYSSTIPVGGAASYKLWPVFTHSNGYWKCRDTFRGIFFWLEEGLKRWGYLGDLSMEEFIIGEENFDEGGAGFLSIFFLRTTKK